MKASPLSVRLSPEMIAGLDRAAERRKITRNAFIVKALQRVLDGEPREPDTAAPGANS